MLVKDIAFPDSKFFLKSEYGPMSHEWPVVAFTVPALRNKLSRDYQTGRDFIVYTGTSGPETEDENDRSRLLSIVEIDRTRTYKTKDKISPERWAWAVKNYPNQWEYCFRALRAWDIPSGPSTRDVIGDYSKMGHYPYRSTVLDIEGVDRQALLNVEIVPIENIDVGGEENEMSVSTLLRPENRLLNQEATRLAELVFSRVELSGQAIKKVAPIRTAPTSLLLSIARLLAQSPLTCALCGGLMELRPANKLLQPSGDRKDSSNADYGPENYQLVHLACNLGKNNATTEHFQEWLDVVRRAVIDDIGIP